MGSPIGGKRAFVLRRTIHGTIALTLSSGSLKWRGQLVYFTGDGPCDTSVTSIFFGSAFSVFPMSTPNSTHQVMPFENERVRFTPLQMENIHTHLRWNNDPELNRMDSELPHEEESFGTFKERFEQLCNDPSSEHRDFEIHDRVQDELIGVAYVAQISPHHHHALVGVTIGERDYWGQGYGKASLGLLLRYCFQELELHRVSAEAFEYNSAWRDLIESMGFTKEGTAREYLYREGQYWDKELYALLEQEYREHFEETSRAASAETAV